MTLGHTPAWASELTLGEMIRALQFARIAAEQRGDLDAAAKLRGHEDQAQRLLHEFKELMAVQAAGRK